MSVVIRGTDRLPVLPLKNITLFPHMVLHFDVGRPASVAAVEAAMQADRKLMLITQRDNGVEEPSLADLYSVGTIAHVKQIVKQPGGHSRVLVEGEVRARLVDVSSAVSYLYSNVSIEEEYGGEDSPETDALKRVLIETFTVYGRLSGRITQDSMDSVTAITDVGRMADVMASGALNRVEDKQEVLGAFDINQRMEQLLLFIGRENKSLEVERTVRRNLREQLEKHQREYMLREQLKVIHKELGEKGANDVTELRERLEQSGISGDGRAAAEKELGRMELMPAASPELTVSRTYVEWLLDMPWGIETEDVQDLKYARRVLSEDHNGLEKVKERVVEYLAVHKLTDAFRGLILCFVGPPGVGKTSISKSIARALGRKFVRMSLGGVRDEAEIRGHRRTYIGAIPGRVIYAMKQAGSMNPVMLFDEIDKMASDMRGDPASAMLELLDAEQNNAFRDHYLEVPFDMSRTMFITTANTLDTIPRALLDRMEVIRLEGYTEDEKRDIAVSHLIPKQLKEHGMDDGDAVLRESALRALITGYTREAGVRNLEREIASLIRKAAIHKAEGKRVPYVITSKRVGELLGAPRYHYDAVGSEPIVGVANGLAWTAVGGDTLSIEASVMPGSGQLTLTGHLGDVMKESAQAARSYIRERAAALGIKKDFHKQLDIHVHIPEGATPKEGPSAGITLAVAIASALSGKAVRQDIAMTGEITLRGRVLPIGGLKEKCLAARRAGITTVLFPTDNQKDIDEMPKNALKGLTLIAVSDMDEVLGHALAGGIIQHVE